MTGRYLFLALCGMLFGIPIGGLCYYYEVNTLGRALIAFTAGAGLYFTFLRELADRLFPRDN